MNNNIIVLKFGGTSMGNTESILKCVDVVNETLKKGKKPFVVVSALSGITNKLIELVNFAKAGKRTELNRKLKFLQNKHYEVLNELANCNANLYNDYITKINDKLSSLQILLEGIFLSGDYTKKMYANILSYGEDLSSELMELALEINNIKSKKIHSKELIKTEGSFLSADIDFKMTKNHFQKKTLSLLNNGVVPVMTGFFGGNKNKKNLIMLLGRGGSDFSASIAGIALDAELVEIWTDVDGIMSTDPRITKQAITWEQLNVEIASEMARAGAKVLHPKTIYAALNNIEIIIKNLFNRKFKGTLISNKKSDGIKGVVLDHNNKIIHLRNNDMFGNVGFIAKVTEKTAEFKIPIDVCTTSETCFSFSFKDDDYQKSILKDLKNFAELELIENVTKISIIGENIVEDNSILERIARTFLENDIKIIMSSISCSKNNICLMIKQKDSNKAVIELHKNLFI